MKKILVMNGPNLNMLGIREKGVYGYKKRWEISMLFITEKAKDWDVELEFYQSNHEGAMIDKLHEAFGKKTELS